MLTITNKVINISFNIRVDKRFKKFSYIRKNRYWLIVRNVRSVNTFKDRSNRTGFPNIGKKSFIERMLEKKIDKQALKEIKRSIILM